MTNGSRATGPELFPHKRGERCLSGAARSKPFKSNGKQPRVLLAWTIAPFTPFGGLRVTPDAPMVHFPTAHKLAKRRFNLARHARDALETPAEDLRTEDEREMIGAFVVRRQLRPPTKRGKPFGTDIRSWVVLLARMVGWRLSKRQPDPGNEVLWGPAVDTVAALHRRKTVMTV